MNVKDVLSVISMVVSAGTIVVSAIASFFKRRKQQQQTAYYGYNNCNPGYVANNQYGYGYGYGYQQPSQIVQQQPVTVSNNIPIAPITTTPVVTTPVQSVPVQTTVIPQSQPVQTVVIPKPVPVTPPPIVNNSGVVYPVITTPTPVMNVNPVNTSVVNQNNTTSGDILKWKSNASTTENHQSNGYSQSPMYINPMYSYGYGYADVTTPVYDNYYPSYNNYGYGYTSNDYNNQKYGYGYGDNGYNASQYNADPYSVNYKQNTNSYYTNPNMNNWYSYNGNVQNMNLGSNNMGSYVYNPSSNEVYRWSGVSNEQNNKITQTTTQQTPSDGVVMFGTPDWFVQKAS